MTVFHVLALMGTAAGLVTGATLGYTWLGPIGGVAGAAVGFRLGLTVGCLPMWLGLFHLRRSYLSRRSTAELVADLRALDRPCKSLILLELKSRGHDILQELPVIRELLLSDDPHQRSFGWGALMSAFPEFAKEVADYDPNAPLAVRIARLELLRVAPLDVDSPHLLPPRTSGGPWPSLDGSEDSASSSK